MDTIDWEKFDYVEETMAADFYSGTFYSFILKYKDDYNLVAEDQSDYFMESLFLLCIQICFCTAILDKTEWNLVFKYENDFTLDLCTYFTSLILHFASLFSVRNGIQMMRGVVYNHEGMTHPEAGFLLGFMVIIVNFLC